MSTTRRSRLLLVPIAGLVLLACGGGEPQGPGDGGGNGNGADPSISLSLDASSLTVTQGESGELTATVSRSGGFSGEVTLAASGLPDGVSVPSVTVPSGATEGTLTVEASASAATGTNSVTVEASGSGVSSVSESFELTVEESEEPGTTTALTFCEEESVSVPEWVAFKDGDGPWRRVQADAGNTYSVEHAADRVGLATADVQSDGSTSTDVTFLSGSELERLGDLQCAGSESEKSVNGSVAGLASDEAATISLGGAFTFATPSQTSFTLEGVADGPQDLVAGRTAQSQNAQITNALILRRDLNPADGGSLAPLDFEAEGFAPVSAEFTLEGPNVGTDAEALTVGFVAGGGAPGLGSFPAPLFTVQDPALTQEYRGVPSDRLAQGDVHVASLNAVAPGSNDPRSRTVTAVFREAGDRTLTLGPYLDAPQTATASGAPYPRLEARYTVQADYDDTWTVRFTSASGDRTVAMSATDGWLGGQGELVLTLPDFSEVDGWENDWVPAGGQNVSWAFTGVGFVGSGTVVGPSFTEEGVIRIARDEGTLSVP